MLYYARRYRLQALPALIVMSRLIISLFACVCMSACSVADLRLVHRIDVQQGNVITQEVVNQLKPGMTRRQVQYLAGSPMVVDVFHQDRWDYVYRHTEGHGETVTEHITLHFENDALARISGTLRPSGDPDDSRDTRAHETHTVPPQDRTPPGIFSRFWRWITFRSEPDARP